MSELSRLQLLTDAQWAPALAAAAHNRRHVVCPDGFESVIRRLTDEVLVVAANIAAERAKSEGGGGGGGNELFFFLGDAAL